MHVDDWIAEAVAEYADDLGVLPDELSERERLEAIEDRIDRHARAAASQRRAPARSRRESVADSPDFDDSPRSRGERDRFADSLPDYDRAPLYERAPSRASSGRLERAIEEIERRAERNEERTARALESLSAAVQTRGGERNRLEKSVEDIEKRAQRNEERTVAAIEALQKLVAHRGGERARLEQAVAEVEARAKRNAERTAKALENLSQMVVERDEERHRLESAIARANRQSEESEARAARALESLAQLVAEPVGDSPTDEPIEAIASHEATYARPVSAPAPDDEDEDDAVRAVAERLARRRRERTDAPADPAAGDLNSSLGSLRRDLRQLSDKVEHLSTNAVGAPALSAFRTQTRDVERALTAAAEKVADANRMQSKVAALLERVERLAAAQPASGELAKALNALADAHAKVDRQSPLNAIKSVERQIGDLGARVEAAARRSPHEAKAIEDLGRRIESLRSFVERQSAGRPDAAELNSLLSTFNKKLDQAASAGAQSTHKLTSLADMVARLESEIRRPGAISIDPRPIEDLSRRIDGMRGEIEKQRRIEPKVDDLHATLADLARKLESQASSPNEMAWLEESLADIRARIDSPAFAQRLDLVDHALNEIAARVEESALRPANVAFDQKPFEDIARRIESVRGEVEKQGRLAPKFDDIRTALNEIARRIDRSGAPAKDLARIEETLAAIRARVDHPAPSAQMEAVEATLRQMAAKLEEAAARPQTIALESKPIEELARRIESVRTSLERTPSLIPQVERLEAALSNVVEKLDRAAEADPIGINATLSDMKRRLEEAFKGPQIAGREGLDELTAQVEAVRETVERHIAQFDARRLEMALQEAVEKFERPVGDPSDLHALTSAVEALASRLDDRSDQDFGRLERALEDIAARLSQPGVVASPSVGPLADAIAALGAKIDRLRPDDVAALTETMTTAARKMDRVEDVAFRDAHLENLVHEIVDRLAGIESRLDSASSAASSAGWSPVEAAIRELNDRIADIRASSDTRVVEQDLRALHDKIDDLADTRRHPDLAAETAQLVVREIAPKLVDGGQSDTINHLLDIQERLDRLAAARQTPATLELALNDFAEQMDALRATNEAARRDGATVSDLRAEQAAFDRRLDARFSGVQDVLEKLVDRMARFEREIAAETRAPGAAPTPPAPGLVLPDIPDRDPVLRAPKAEPPRVTPLPRQRDEATAGKTAAINAHIAAARRAASAAVDGDARKTGGDERRSVEGMAQRAQSLWSTNSRPVLLSAAGALALVTGVTVYEMRGHAPIRKSELEVPAAASTSLASATPATTPTLDESPTGAIGASPSPSVSPSAAPSESASSNKPSQTLLAAIPAGFDTALASAAAKGDFGAEIEIAQRYLEGRTVARDPKTAADWLQTATDAGSPFAAYRLGALYEKGVGVTRDLGKARELYTKAGEAGNARAMHNLAVLFAQDGGSGKPDYAAALDWFRRAGTLGVRDSQFNLGVLYGRGLGAKQDLAQSWVWFSLAAKQGDTDAAHKRDEVAIRMDGRMMADAKKMLDDFKVKTPDPAINEPPHPPSTAADAAPGAAKPGDAKPGGRV